VGILAEVGIHLEEEEIESLAGGRQVVGKASLASREVHPVHLGMEGWEAFHVRLEEGSFPVAYRAYLALEAYRMVAVGDLLKLVQLNVWINDRPLPPGKANGGGG